MAMLSVRCVLGPNHFSEWRRNSGPGYHMTLLRVELRVKTMSIKVSGVCLWSGQKANILCSCSSDLYSYYFTSPF